jgi:DEAD/DEAH box helicase domain-containing protein
MHTQPNYGALLQSFWSPPTPSIEHTEQGVLTEPTALVDFLGEDLLWGTTYRHRKQLCLICQRATEVN